MNDKLRIEKKFKEVLFEHLNLEVYGSINKDKLLSRLIKEVLLYTEGFPSNEGLKKELHNLLNEAEYLEV